MTKERSFKRRVRERMTKTGESYAAARGHVSQKRDRVQAAEERLAGSADRPSEEKLVTATGRTWNEWFALLDRRGARDHKHGDTVAHLIGEHGVPHWWAQAVTGWYERARGLRVKHQQPDGFTVWASRTIAAPAAVLFHAFVDPPTRQEWLTDGDLTLRTSRPDLTARFDWGDGTTRVSVSFEDKGAAKTTVAVAHERLPDPDEAETAKALWRKRLAELKSFVEG